MNLIDSMKEPFYQLVTVSSPDGEGGENVTWNEGQRIFIACIRSHASEGTVAGKKDAVSAFTMAFYRDAELKYGDYLRRESDGAAFRITSPPVQPPGRTAVKFMLATAEQVVLP